MKKTKTVQIVELNNKTRKGTYLYIKEGKKSRYLKYKENDIIDPYLQYDRDKQKKSLKGTKSQYIQSYTEKLQGQKPKQRTAVHRQAEQYLQRIRKSGSLESNLKTGLQSVTLKNIHLANMNRISEAKKMLFSNIVLDKQLLNIITKEENIRKLANRFEYRYTYYNSNGEILAVSSVFGISPEKALYSLKNAVTKGTEVKSEYDKGFKNILAKENHKGIDIKGEGRIDRIDVTIIFRKG